MLFCQVIELSAHSSFSGCVTELRDGRREVFCRNERRYDHPQRMHMAVSDCRSSHGIQIHYRLDFYGFTNADELCSSAPRNDPDDRRTLMMTSLAVAFVVRVAVAPFGAVNRATGM
jgi:hypothetical protein